MEPEIEKIMNQWIEVGHVDDVPRLGSRVVSSPFGDIAIFKTKDNQLFALRDKCPHKGGALSQGIIHGHKVTCPLHNWVISLLDGEAQGFDEGCTTTYQVKTDGSLIYLALSETAEASQTAAT